MKNIIIGTWKLISYNAYITDTKESVNHPYGKSPKGLLIYTKEGYMCGQVMNCERPLLSNINSFNDGTNEEIKLAYQGYVAYFGKYEINQEEKYVSHFVEGSLIPKWVNTTLIRYYDLSDNKLKLTTPPIKLNETSYSVTLTFNRMNI